MAQLLVAEAQSLVQGLQTNGAAMAVEDTPLHGYTT